MEDWLSYRLSDLVLFSPRTYYRTFAQYHTAIWPAQIVLFASAIALPWLNGRRDQRSGRVAAALLATWWLWVALAFHASRYSTINWAAKYFVALFVVQSLLLVRHAIAREQTKSRAAPRLDSAIATVLFGCALAAPLASRLAGRDWQQVEMIGATPDPTAIATLAFALASRRGRGLIAVIPLIWCAIGGATLWALDSGEAWIPLACGIAALVALARRPQVD